MSHLSSFQKALDYIEEHLNEPLKLEHIAEAAFLSLPHFYRVFYSLTGHSLKDYIRKRRISIAAWHLHHSGSSVAAIAHQCGFDSESSFSKIFKKTTGMSPSIYRKTNLYFSFEKIQLAEQVQYMEDRELSNRFPDVKVLQLASMQVHRYTKFAPKLHGIERMTFDAMSETLKHHHLNIQKCRFFGKHADTTLSNASSETYGYEIFIHAADQELHIDSIDEVALPGGLYAVTSVAAAREPEIQLAWNRLQSEWLPRSAFTLGSHPTIEEFMLYGDKIVRMKLYLPVVRKAAPEFIEIIHIPFLQVASFRGYGSHAQEVAETKLLRWFKETAYANTYTGYRCYVSYQISGAESNKDWWEIGIAVKLALEKQAADVIYKTIGGGEYACIRTKALGSLSGVLEIIHQWLFENRNYEFDPDRQWFMEYDTNTIILDEHCITLCAIPVKKKLKIGADKLHAFQR